MLDDGSLQTFAGLQVVTNTSMIEPGEPYYEIRSWKERLFSRPWRPLRKFKIIIPQIPSKQVLQFGNTLVMHPEMAKEMAAQMEKENKQ